jgi:hypothetical protein
MRGVLRNVNRIVGGNSLQFIKHGCGLFIKSYLQFADVNYEYCQKFRIV